MKSWYEILFSNYAEKYENENTWILKSLGHYSDVGGQAKPALNRGRRINRRDRCK